MDIFRPNFPLKIKISSSGNGYTVKYEAAVEDIIMVIYGVGFYDKI